jgi:hypothetical protein
MNGCFRIANSSGRRTTDGRLEPVAAPTTANEYSRPQAVRRQRQLCGVRIPIAVNKCMSATAAISQGGVIESVAQQRGCLQFGQSSFASQSKGNAPAGSFSDST